MEGRMIEQMEKEARMQLAETSDTKARACIRSSHMGNEIEVRARRLKNGNQVFGYSLCAVKLERAVLLQLLCPEPACPHCLRTQARWRTFQGLATPASPQLTRESFEFRHLVDEVAIQIDSRTYLARPAVFQCLTPCPVNAHPPAVIRRTGWDVFADGHCLAGGLVMNAGTGMAEPRFPSIDAVRAWIGNTAM
jgi:hypothetical protein